MKLSHAHKVSLVLPFRVFDKYSEGRMRRPYLCSTSSFYTKKLIAKENRANKHRIALSTDNDHCWSLYTVESRFYEPPRETKIGSKIRKVREIGGKIMVFD